MVPVSTAHRNGLAGMQHDLFGLGDYFELRLTRTVVTRNSLSYSLVSPSVPSPALSRRCSQVALPVLCRNQFLRLGPG